MSAENEIILYQPDESISIEVRVADETVWLTQQQMADLFLTTRNNITLHINNIFKEGELSKVSVCKDSLLTANDGKKYRTKLYSLDVIISVGYRVKSVRGTAFRQWANKVLKEHLLRGYSVNQFLLEQQNRVIDHEKRIEKIEGKIDFFIKTSISPHEGIVFEGQIFDAYILINDLIRSAKNRIVIIDNYVDDSVLKQLTKRSSNVSATIYTSPLNKIIKQDIKKHNSQYPSVSLKFYQKAHDRFLIIDNTVFHIGASLKDLGKKLFAFSRMECITADELLKGMEY